MTATHKVEDDISVPLSALEHVAYCHRQAALIHVEAVWGETIETIRGDIAHRAVDIPGLRRRPGLVAVRALPVSSQTHGLHGVCDLVEFTGHTAAPVEYKVGTFVPGGPADVQLAGQALCLREAGFDVPVGHLYCAAERRRHAVPITDNLVRQALAAAETMRALLAAQTLPTAHNDTRCRKCSLRDDCLPEITQSRTVPGAHQLFNPRPLGTWHD